jgi:bleomycin hydrolase
MFFANSVVAATDKEIPGKQFTILHEVWSTPRKSQGNTWMCWAFSTSSLFESELKRLGAGEFELSPAYIAYFAFLEKADRYFYRQGGTVFSAGGLPHDVIYIMKKYGAVPLDSYTGLLPQKSSHSTHELRTILDGFMAAVLKVGEDGSLSSRWTDGKLKSPWRDDLRDILDNHLGKPPESIEYRQRKLTPLQFVEEVVDLPFDEYVEITSYSYLPLYGKGELQLHDNWLHYDDYYNVPLEDYISIIDFALENGYSLVFDLHTTADLYKDLQGVAELEEEPADQVLDQDSRDNMIEDWSTTDVHLVHCIGIARDQSGRKYYMVKDSWTSDEGPREGLQYLSENFVRGKALFIMMHKDGLPLPVKDRLQIK